MEQTEKKEPFYNQIEKYIIVCMFLVMTVIIALNVVTRFVFNFTLSWGGQVAAGMDILCRNQLGRKNQCPYESDCIVIGF